MKKGKEFRSRILSQAPYFDYLSDKDRYLLAVDKPTYRFNVIGTGNNGREHIRVTLLEGRAVVNGVYDPNELSAAKAQEVYSRYGGQEELVIYDSLTAACNDPAVDALIISTPNYTHIDVVREAIRSGKHILLEKPMATTVADAYEIMQIAEEYASIFQVGLQYRFKAGIVEAIQEVLVRQSLGDIKTVSILEHRIPFLDKVNQWNKFSQYTGGTLVEKCCHYFDLMNMFARSRPVSVYADGGMAVNFKEFEYGGRKSDILDNAFVIVTYENEVRATLNLCMFAPLSHEELIVCGDAGRLRFCENQNFLSNQGSGTQLEIMRGESGPSSISSPSYPRYIEESGHNGSTFYEHIYFVDNMEGKATNTATALEGFWSVVVGAAAEESIKTGLPVSIDTLLKRELPEDVDM